MITMRGVFLNFITVAQIFSHSFVLIGCFSYTITSTSTPPVTPSIPRSSERPPIPRQFPWWNPSTLIDENGFLIPTYQRVPGEWEEVKLRNRDQIIIGKSPAKIRQVPGDGSCLFHSISLCYAHAIDGTHLDIKCCDNRKWLHRHSSKLRQLAVDVLEEKKKVLFLQGNEYVYAKDLVNTAAEQYGITGKKYCDTMRKESYWGGGPEIVALCNVLQRPIHVYELHVLNQKNTKWRRIRNKVSTTGGGIDCQSNTPPTSTSSSSSSSSLFVLRRMASFGSPDFDNEPALHILSADSRFPELEPGEQLKTGNHFMAVFPSDTHAKKSLEPINEIQVDSSRLRRLFWHF